MVASNGVLLIWESGHPPKSGGIRETHRNILPWVIPIGKSPNIYFDGGIGCEVLWWVCLCVSVCLSARISPDHTRDLYQICMHVAYGRGSVLLLRRCDTLCTSGFVDDIMFISTTARPYSGMNYAIKDRFRLNVLICLKLDRIYFHSFCCCCCCFSYFCYHVYWWIKMYIWQSLHTVVMVQLILWVVCRCVDCVRVCVTLYTM